MSLTQTLLQGVGEGVFDAVYLVSVFSMGCAMLLRSYDNGQRRLLGMMAIVLALGDAFHLVPRVWALCTTGLDTYTAALGIGKLITSITMTLFYLMLYRVWRMRYRIRGYRKLNVVVVVLALLRIGLCLFPQNGWTSENPSLLWAVARNIPFLILGMIVMVVFFKEAVRSGDRSFGMVWLAVLLSFLFYIPVVLFAQSYPLVGLLMLPKTAVYAWIVYMGYREIRIL